MTRARERERRRADAIVIDSDTDSLPRRRRRRSPSISEDDDDDSFSDSSSSSLVLPPTPPPPPPPKLPSSYPIFRTDKKLLELLDKGYLSEADYARVSSIPLYRPKVQKVYAFSHVHDFDTWMADIVFFKEDCLDIRFNQYEQQLLRRDRTPADVDRANRLLEARDAYPVLLFIHCNSRLARAFLLSSRHHRIQDIQPCFQYMLTTYGPRFKVIITDAAREFPRVCRDLNLHHIALNMSSPDNYHTMLAPLDRFCRTLRDMLYNLKRQHVVARLGQPLLNKCCEVYNNISHDTLTKVLGFNCSPQECFDNRPVETEFIRRLTARNYNRVLGNFEPQEEVFIYQPKEPFKKRRNNVLDDSYSVVGKNRGRFVLQNNNNPTDSRLLPRSWFVRR